MTSTLDEIMAMADEYANNPFREDTQGYTTPASIHRAQLLATMTDLIGQHSALISALKDIARGHHDPTPTRRLHLSNTDAGQVDDWWQAYYLDNDARNKEIARNALRLVDQ